MGTVRLSKGRDLGDNHVTLHGWGLGAAYNNPGDWFARVDYARRIGLDSSVAAKNSARNRVWVMAGGAPPHEWGRTLFMWGNKTAIHDGVNGKDYETQTKAVD